MAKSTPHHGGWGPPLACSAVGLVSAFLLAVDGEASRLLDPSSWIAFALLPEYLLYVCWIGLGLVVWLGSLLYSPRKPPNDAENQNAPLNRFPAVLRLAIFVVTSVLGFGSAAYFGYPTRHLPPAFHDEYSYLFQARTFGEGQLTVPSPPAYQHFAQMHVLVEENRSASRYFPATGLWILPFEKIGAEVASGWVAQGLVVGFFSLAACEVSIPAAMILAPWLIASPGLVVFANTFLSPHPTMLGLAVGWWAFVRSRRIDSSPLWVMLIGVATGWSFLARPVTTIALALPWMLDLARRSLVKRPRHRNLIIMFTLGFLPAPIALACFNASITGSALQTPYGKYTAEYSPCHVYGFYNRTRGEQVQASHRLDAFDDWAPELTPRRAWNLTKARWNVGLPWILGAIPLVVGAAIAGVHLRSLGDAIALPATSILCLTCAHVPFAFQGIFGWSYLTEATPFVLWISALGFARMIAGASGERKRLITLWGGAGMAIPVFISFLLVLPAAFSESSEFIYPRRRQAERWKLESALSTRPSVIIYDIDPRDDLHATYVTNSPTFDDPILRAWMLGDPRPLMSAYPDRDVYLCRRAGDGYRYEKVQVGRP